MTNSFYNLISRFRRNVGGGVAIMAGLTIGLVGTSVIAAVDIADMNATKNKMQDRIDSAVLLATLQESLREAGSAEQLQATGRKFVLDAVKNSGIRAEDITTSFVYDAARERLVGEVSFTPPAIFVGSLIAPRGMTVRAEASPLKPTKMEVALVLDISGSMNWAISSDIDAPVGSRRIDALREGVNTLVSSLDDAPRLDPNFAVIPYATSVDTSGLMLDAGTNVASWYEGANGGDLPELCKSKKKKKKDKDKGKAYGHYKDCKSNDDDDDDDDDDDGDASGTTVLDPSPIGAWGAERYVAKNGSSFNLSIDAPGGTKKVPVITQPARTTYCDPSYVNKYGEQCAEFVIVDENNYWEKDYFAPRSGVLPLTDEPQDVLDFMGTLDAQGGTAGHIGAAWGLYALADSWGDVFQHPTGTPSRFNSPTQKVMIMMTDGDFTMTHDDAMTVEETYDYFQEVCSLARSKGVLIYTVGLRASALTDSQLTTCAGSAEQYFPADSRAALVNAFEEIASKATQVRLSH